MCVKHFELFIGNLVAINSVYFLVENKILRVVEFISNVVFPPLCFAFHINSDIANKGPVQFKLTTHFRAYRRKQSVHANRNSVELVRRTDRFELNSVVCIHLIKS